MEDQMMDASKSTEPVFKQGDRVGIKNCQKSGRIVELHGPLDPGGCQFYRVYYSASPSGGTPKCAKIS